ncbi:hypothetical protein POM88_016317 [Heracleum sosnowskyi]|uniref:Thiamine biosynthesis protein n=1 Tax=Heracleum sosnowskyi TaxID=360622 RepID=A0AAD8IN95_9APIA|nr:hypothetical protein POM88_016317 [Heracleum sosnowskyi]
MKGLQSILFFQCGQRDAMQKFTTEIVNMMKAEELYETQGGPIIMSQPYGVLNLKAVHETDVFAVTSGCSKQRVPHVLTVAGSDSGAGAGIQADLKACAARGVYCTTVITAVTAQNTVGVQGVNIVPERFVSEQLQSVLSDMHVDVFSFAKVWLLAAQFEMKQLNLIGARSILGQAIGKAHKDKIFKKYIEIELQLGNIDRCRKLYEKYVEWSPENCYAWSKYADLERSLSETDRARAIFELGIAQPQEALFATVSSDQDNSDSRRRYFAI